MTDQENSYVIDPENAAEMARLLDQDVLMTHALGGLVPEPLTSLLEQGLTILDLGCGPAGWAQEVLYAYPNVKSVVGVDISQKMIKYARAQAMVQGLENRTQFLTTDLTKLPWSLPDVSFEIVNARFMAGFLNRNLWPEVVKESFRVLVPGGYVILTEPEWTTTNSPAGERLGAMALQAFHRSGLGFSQDGRNLGIIHTLDPLLRDQGGLHIGLSAHILNMTYGRDYHLAGTKNLFLAYHFMADFFVKTGVAGSKQEVIDLCEQFRTDVSLPTFCGSMIMVRAWAQKPVQAP